MLRAAWVALAVLACAHGAELVPLRWAWKDAKPLSLLKGTPVNCVLLEPDQVAVAEAAAAQGLTPLAVVRPGGKTTVAAAFRGVVMEGDFPAGTAAGNGLVIALPSRATLFATAPADGVTGTAEGLWPGIQVLANGAAKAGPSGAPWIDTNGGFLRSMRARTRATLWMANQPPKGMVLKVERYLQAIADAAMNGGRWVIALDDDFARGLATGDAAAVAGWRRMMRHVAFFEERREWLSLPAASKLAIVQDPADGPVLAAGVLDMISTRHTPARALAEDRLAAGSLNGATFAVAVNPERLTAEQKALLQAFTRGGGHAAHRADRVAGRADGEAGVGPVERHLARGAVDDRPAQHGSAAVQCIVYAVERSGGTARASGWCSICSTTRTTRWRT